MITPPAGQEGGTLAQVRQGMDVYGPDDNKIGTVKRVYMGGGNDPADVSRQRHDAGVDATAAERPADATFLGDLMDAFTAEGGLPDELRQKLEREGFVEIDSTGFLAADRYATPDQIARVQEDRVILSTTKQRLIKE